jgi:hypothetical protein
MMGTQCDRGSNSWDTWNEGTQKWIKNTSIPCNELLPADKWLHVVMYNTIDISGNTYTYKTFNIGGKDYILNQTEPTKHVGWPDGKFGVQVQLDLNSSGSAVNEYIENMQVYAW